MKQSTLILIQFILTALCFVFFFTLYTVMDNNGLKTIANLIPSELLIICMITNIFEYRTIRLTKPVYRFVALSLVFMIASFSTGSNWNGQTFNSFLSVLALCYSILLFVFFVVTTKKENKNKKDNVIILPPGVLTERDSYISMIALLSSVVVFVIVVAVIPGIYKLVGALIVLAISFVAFGLIGSLMDTSLKKSLKSFEDSLDYEALDKSFKTIEENPLHEETKNYLNMLRTFYLLYLDMDRASDLFQTLFEPNHKPYKKTYDAVELYYYLYNYSFDLLDAKILEIRNNYSAKQLEELNETINGIEIIEQMFKNNQSDSKVIAIFNKESPTKFSKITGMYALAKYYLLNNDLINFKKIVDDCQSYKSVYPNIIQRINYLKKQN